MKKTLLLLLTLFLIMNSEAQVIENGVYVVRSALNRNHVMDLSGAVARNYNRVFLWTYNGSNAQKWNIKHVKDGYYRFESEVDKGFQLDVCGGTGYNGQDNIQVYQTNFSDAQQWKIVKNGNYYYILSKVGGGRYALDVKDGKLDDGTFLQLWDKTPGNYNQLWILEKVGKSHNGYNDCPLCNGTGYVGNQLCALCLKRATGR